MALLQYLVYHFLYLKFALQLPFDYSFCWQACIYHSLTPTPASHPKTRYCFYCSSALFVRQWFICSVCFVINCFSFLLLSITKTYLYNFDPLEPHFYIVKLGFTGVYIIFLISAQKHTLWVLVRTASMRWFYRVPTIYVLSRNKKKYQNFYLKTFRFCWCNFQYIWIGVFS